MRHSQGFYLTEEKHTYLIFQVCKPIKSSKYDSNVIKICVELSVINKQMTKVNGNDISKLHWELEVTAEETRVTKVIIQGKQQIADVSNCLSTLQEWGLEILIHYHMKTKSFFLLTILYIINKHSFLLGKGISTLRDKESISRRKKSDSTAFRVHSNVSKSRCGILA